RPSMTTFGRNRSMGKGFGRREFKSASEAREMTSTG
ncbi:MAG: hypothetical protein RL385_5388, partial [Pseudomonadota bacterium]